jgi:hypothetical protein
MGDSLVRAFPFNHVKSANENGSSFDAFGVPDFPFSVACGPIDAITRSLDIAFPPPAGAELELSLSRDKGATIVFAEAGCEYPVSLVGAGAIDAASAAAVEVEIVLDSGFAVAGLLV